MQPVRAMFSISVDNDLETQGHVISPVVTKDLVHSFLFIYSKVSTVAFSNFSIS